jgi:predicted NBD/HSP70 family sugar kinase
VDLFIDNDARQADYPRQRESFAGSEEEAMADLATALAHGGAVQVAASERSRGTNQQGVRLYNERLALALIRREGPLPKAEIARLTGLSPMTTTTIMNRLDSDGLLLRQDKVRGRVGQPSTPYALNPEGSFSLGLKIGRRSAELVLADFSCAIRDRVRSNYIYPDPAALMAWLETAIDEISRRMSPPARRRISGIGIAMPFELWNWEGEIGAPADVLDSWRSFDVQQAVENISGFEVRVCNDATAACGAELMVGKGAAYRDFLYVYFGAFVGGGVVLNYQLYPGRTGNAAAIGSMPVSSLDPQGRLVRSQLIRQASLYLLEDRIRAAGGDPSSIWLLPGDWDDYGETLERWLDDVAAAIAPALIAGTAIIDFQAIVIDGALPKAVRARLVNKIAAEIGAADRQGLTPVEILEGSIGPDARPLGAAILPLIAAFAPDHDVLLKEARV